MRVVFCKNNAKKKIEMGSANSTNMEANYAKILRQKTEAYIEYINSEEFAAVVAENVFNAACKYAEIGKNAVDINLIQILIETDPNVPELLRVFIADSVKEILANNGIKVAYNRANGNASLSW